MRFIFLIIMGFVMTSCKGASDGNAPSDVVPPNNSVTQLSISPTATALAINNNFNFTASGGTAPYNFSIVSGGGFILTVADVGQFTAPGAPGVVVIQLTDSSGALVTATVTVQPALQISPVSQTITTNSTLNMSATGGVSPYFYSIASGLGSVDSVTGLYTAPGGNSIVNLIVTDSIGNTSSAAITVTSVLSLNPGSVSLVINDTQTFSASGGTPPLVYSIFSGAGSINASSGLFTAPGAAGTTVVRVTDALGANANTTVTIYPSLTLTPASITVSVNGSLAFSASGGIAPNTFSILSGAGSINASTGAYTAPATSGSAVIQVTDSAGHTANSNVTITNALGINPAAKTLAVNNTQTFSATGGASPFTYSIVSGGGTINATTGLFTAPASAGSVTVRVTDSLSNVSNATVTVVSAVLISPITKVLAPNNIFSFTASGGFAPYVYSVFSGPGTINSSTGAYTAPATSGSAVVRVTDALGQTSDSAVTINSALAINPGTISLAVNNTHTFAATGGVSPYAYSIVSGGGTINSSTGLFTAPASAGSVTVRVTDSLLNTSMATVTVNAALAISPASITLAVNNVTSFSATGGVSPYTYSIVSGGGIINSSTGIFTAPASAGSVTVRVTDSLSNISNATVTVNAALAISPATVTLAVNGTQTFTSSGGVGTKTYSIVSGGGTINSSTGAFTAPGTSQSVTVRVTDMLSNNSDSTVTVNGPLAISPVTINIVANGAQTFIAAGGVPPYTYSIFSGTGTIDSVTGEYIAGASAGTDVVRVTDSASAFVNSTVTVYDSLTLSPTAATFAINATQSFTATGGLGARTFSIVSGGGSINSSTGLFTASATAGTTEIKVQDTIANSVTATLTIVSSLSITPATLKLPVFSTGTFSAVLGTAPYTYSLFSGTGSVVSGTGVYTGGPAAGTDYIRVTDLGMNTSDAAVTLIEPVQIVSGSAHACVRYNEGSVKCWGLNSSGQLGLGDTLSRGDTLNETGSNLPFVNLGTGRTAKMLTAGYKHTCAILDNNSVKCWGLNSSGQLGQGDTTVRGTTAATMGDNLLTVNLGTGRTAKKIAAGNAHTCAILDNDTLKCWGVNTYGQLGQGNTTIKGSIAGTMGDSLLAINLGAGRTAKEVSAGLDHTCVILDNNNLKCFGRNNYGQLGYDSITTLGDGAGEMAALANINLGAGRTATAISNGYSFTCVLLDNGTVKCFGRNQSGQLGKDNVTNLGDTAGEMAALTNINLGFTATKISASRQRACAMNATVVKCWGLNTSGQLLKGNTTALGDTAGEMAALTAMNFGTGVIASEISSAYYSSCIITTNKRIKCFGSAGSGYLLNTSTTSHLGDAAGEVGDGLPFVNH